MNSLSILVRIRSRRRQITRGIRHSRRISQIHPVICTIILQGLYILQLFPLIGRIRVRLGLTCSIRTILIGIHRNATIVLTELEDAVLLSHRLLVRLLNSNRTDRFDHLGIDAIISICLCGYRKQLRLRNIQDGRQILTAPGIPVHVLQLSTCVGYFKTNLQLLTVFKTIRQVFHRIRQNCIAITIFPTRRVSAEPFPTLPPSVRPLVRQRLTVLERTMHTLYAIRNVRHPLQVFITFERIIQRLHALRNLNISSIRFRPDIPQNRNLRIDRLTADRIVHGLITNGPLIRIIIEAAQNTFVVVLSIVRTADRNHAVDAVLAQLDRIVLFTFLGSLPRILIKSIQPDLLFCISRFRRIQIDRTVAVILDTNGLIVLLDLVLDGLDFFLGEQAVTVGIEHGKPPGCALAHGHAFAVHLCGRLAVLSHLLGLGNLIFFHAEGHLAQLRVLSRHSLLNSQQFGIHFIHPGQVEILFSFRRRLRLLRRLCHVYLFQSLRHAVSPPIITWKSRAKRPYRPWPSDHLPKPFQMSEKPLPHGLPGWYG